METSRENKIAIVERNIEMVLNTLYDFSIQVRVANKIKDQEMKKTTTAQMVKFEKMKDEYELILKELREVK